jgi:hypothetical protein
MGSWWGCAIGRFNSFGHAAKLGPTLFEPTAGRSATRPPISSSRQRPYMRGVERTGALLAHLARRASTLAYAMIGLRGPRWVRMVQGPCVRTPNPAETRSPAAQRTPYTGWRARLDGIGQCLRGLGVEPIKLVDAEQRLDEYRLLADMESEKTRDTERALSKEKDHTTSLEKRVAKLEREILKTHVRNVQLLVLCT